MEKFQGAAVSEPLIKTAVWRAPLLGFEFTASASLSQSRSDRQMWRAAKLRETAPAKVSGSAWVVEWVSATAG
jgi:hypothetical protein